jgi:hypothetical protein
MIKTKKYSSTIAFWLVVIAADLFVYFVLGILQMDYDDSYQGPESEYGSLASMTSLQLLFGLILIARKIFNHLK